jgi:hypothetical protein
MIKKIIGFLLSRGREPKTENNWEITVADRNKEKATLTVLAKKGEKRIETRVFLFPQGLFPEIQDTQAE